MADIPQYAWAIDQAGPKLTAAILRGQHHDSTSGGTGVGSPRALKVVPQAAPDNTVLILPGGGTAKSTYPGHENQSYQGTNFKPQTLEIPPTGSSSGGRTDLIIQRFLDPNEEPHPDYSGEYPIPPEVAKTLWQWRIECKTGMDRTATFDYPHVQLGEIVRPANTTIVDDSHIIDLRQLANPKSDRVKVSQNVNTRQEVTRTGTARRVAEFEVLVPEWATHAAIDVSLGGAYMRGASGRGWLGIAAFNNTAYNETTPWWEEGGSTTGFRRIPYIQAGRTLAIAPERRGTVQPVLLSALVNTASDSNFIFGVDAGARAFLDIDWLQGTE